MKVNNFKKSKNFFFLISAIFFVNFANAQTKTWQGSASGGSWTTVSNWGGSAPLVNNDIIINLSQNMAITSIPTTSFNNITINNTTANSLTLTLTGSTLNFKNIITTGGPITISGSTISNISPSITNFNINNTTTINNVMSNNAPRSKNGLGTLILGGTNTMTGQFIIFEGKVETTGTTKIADAQPIRLNGGTLSTGVTTTGFSETVGNLGLLENSTITLKTGNHTITFATSNSVPWTAGKILTITGWAGTIGNNTTGTGGKVVFTGTNGSGLTASQLSQINFIVGSVSYPATILTTGEIVPSSTSPWIQGGNNVSSAQNIGTKTNFDLPFVTNNVERMRITKDGEIKFSNLTNTSPSNFLTVDSSGKLVLASASSNGGGTTITEGTNINVTGTPTTGYTISSPSQVLSQSGNTISLSNNGGSFTLPTVAVTGTATIDLTLTGSVIEADIKNASVTSAKIADLTIATADIADNAVTVAKLPSGATATTFLRGDGTWVTPSVGVTTNVLTLSDGNKITSTVNGIDSNTITIPLIQGTPGTNGQGVPTGGTTGQILAKTSNTNYATEWVNMPSGGSTVINAGTNVDVTGDANTGYTISVPNIGGSYSNPNVYTIKATNSPAGLNANAIADSTTDLDDIINAVLTAGIYKKIYITEGTYNVNSTIDLAGKSDITIEGAGKSTIITGLISPVFNLGAPGAGTISSSQNWTERNDIKNFSINGGANTAIRIGARAQRNIIDNIYITGDNTSSNAGLLVELDGATSNLCSVTVSNPSGTCAEADYNTFKNLYFTDYNNAIVFNNNLGVFNDNYFDNIYFNRFKTALDLGTATGTTSQNKFSNFHVQATPGSSEYVINNIRGDRNIFSYINVFDWQTELPSKFIFNITLDANNTTIENSILKSDATQSYDSNWFVNDASKTTKLINVSSTNGLSENVLKGMNDFAVIGQTKFSDPNIVNFSNFNDMSFRGRTLGTPTNPTLSGSIDFTDFNTIKIGKKRNENPNLIPNGGVGSSYYSSFSKTIISGDLQFQPHNSGILNSSGNYYLGNTQPTPTCVLTNADGNGLIQWTKISSLATKNLYDMDGTINANRVVTINDQLQSLIFRTKDHNTGTYDNTLSIRRRKVYIGSTGNLFNNFDNALWNDHKDYVLIVNGKARVKDEILVQSTGLTWADYVFKKDYKLNTLSEVESFIKENGHLPNMPSAKEIETNGLPLANITTLQQEKIEELTLYAIDQDKKLEAQQKEIEALKKAVEQLINKK